MDKAIRTRRLDGFRTWWFLKKLGVSRFWKDKLPRELAWKLPRIILLWAVVRAAAMAAGHDKNPLEVTANEMLAAVDPRPYPKMAATTPRQTS